MDDSTGTVTAATTDEVPRASSRAWAWRLVPLVLSALVFIVAVPRADECFRDFGVALPRATVWLLDARRGTFDFTPGGSRGGFLAAKLAIKAVLALVAMAIAAVGMMRKRDGISKGLLWLGVLALVYQALAIGLPLLSMSRSLQHTA